MCAWIEAGHFDHRAVELPRPTASVSDLDEAVPEQPAQIVLVEDERQP